MTKATSQTQPAVPWRAARSGVFLPAVSLLTIFVMATLSRPASAAGFDVSGTDPDALPVVPAGFVATMPAREPLVRNVSMLAFDTRGRLYGPEKGTQLFLERCRIALEAHQPRSRCRARRRMLSS